MTWKFGKRFIIGVLLLAAVCIIPGCVSEVPVDGPQAAIAPEHNGFPTEGRTVAVVTRVIDGDTIEVDIAGALYKVRYIGIDTPERGQFGYDEATIANSDLVSGRTVRLEKDRSETDRYGRLLRYVWVDGSMVNSMLVASGYAQAVTYPPDVRYQEEFLELQRQAQQEGLGLWTQR
jgi:endonuclease YncB( thermonuclease family)